MTVRHDRYEVRETLGRGGMGVVYRVFDPKYGVELALKTLPKPDPADQVRLKQEFRHVADLSHPNLVPLHELHLDGEDCFFTMALIEGAPLTSASFTTPTQFVGLARQLVLGVRALHRAGLLHRDIKPENVLVTADHRVVLLDFGLARSIQQHAPATIDGTPAFMDPRLWTGAPPDETSDWYAVGMLLYLALTDELPPPGPVTVPQAPWPLDEALLTTIVGLLHPDVAKRPRWDALWRHLDPAGGPPDEFGAPFVGRADDLQWLRDQLDAARDGLVRCCVRGPSGIGKTRLLEQAFLHDPTAPLTVFRSRCHPQEALAYQALDGIVDQLVESARRDGRSTIDHARFLAELFPVARVFVPDAEAREPLVAQLDAIRELAVEALARLLERSSTAGPPIVLWIDDIQWGDDDSASLVDALVRRLEALPVLLVLSGRDVEWPAGWQSPGAGRDVGPLSPEDARRLGALVAHGASREVEAAAGSPFLIEQLAYTESADVSDWFERRSQTLSGPQRTLVAAVALAGELDEDLTLAAANLDAPHPLAIRELCRQRWLSPARSPERFVPYHDRVREELIRGLTSAERTTLHARLADLLMTRNRDEQAVAHLAGAGRHDEVVEVASRVAERSSATLAFQHAAGLFQTAIDHARTPRPDLWERLADCLVKNGQTVEGARAFDEAATQTRTTQDRVRRLRFAGQHFLRLGILGDGRPRFREVLAHYGVRLPSSMGAVWARVVRYHTWLVLRGFRFRERLTEEVPRATHERIENLWQTATAFALVEFPTSYALSSQGFIESLDRGDRWQVARALGFQGSVFATLGRPYRKMGHRCMAAMYEIVEKLDQPYAWAWAWFCEGSARWMQGRFDESAALVDRAIETFRNQCPGSEWEVESARLFGFSSLSFAGRLDELLPRIEQARREAARRGDDFAINNYRLGQVAVARVLADEPAAVLADARDARATWPDSDYHNLLYTDLVSVAQAHLYRGDVDAAYHVLEDAWPSMHKGQFLTRGDILPSELWFLRGRVALAKAARHPAGRGERRRWLREARRQERRIRRRDEPPTFGWANSLEAGRRALQGESDIAREMLQRAAADYDAAKLRLHRDACHWHLGRHDTALGRLPDPARAAQLLVPYLTQEG